MIVTTNITNTDFDTKRFKDSDDICGFCREHRLDGLELMPYGKNTLEIIPPELVKGVHLTYFNSWVDYWNNQEDGVLQEFGTKETAISVFGGDAQSLVEKYREQLDFAEQLNVQYVVFHVSDVSIRESVSYRFRHSDEEVVKASLELINAILQRNQYSFWFLVENLWYPGFTMTRPEITRRLMDGIAYERKGIMLDVGHLMHKNLFLTTQDEAVAYIHTMLNVHGELCNYIKGVHLHQSLSGAYVRNLVQKPPKIEGSYYDRLGQVYHHILSIDAHRPFTCKSVRGLIDRICPDFLTYEFTTRSREEHESFLTCQNTALMAD